MFPIWDIPAFIPFFSSLKPLLLMTGTVLIWVLTITSVLVQLAVLGFGVFTINEMIQKSE